MKKFDVKKYRLKEQRDRLLRGENIIPWNDPRIVRITDYKARKARQATMKSIEEKQL